MSSGKALREPIFYAGESAYSFQFQDLAVEKYRADNDWLLAKKGFTISDARDVARVIQLLQNDKLTNLMHQARGHYPPALTSFKHSDFP
jgi:hypothetical protein